jgi:PilZ domain
MSQPSDRRHSRIQYPNAARPQITIGGRSFEVIDLSEGGVRFKAEDTPSIAVGDEVSGTVRFRRTETIEIKGSVVRLGGREVALKLDVGIPLRIIIEEQRFLREHHRGTA